MKKNHGACVGEYYVFFTILRPNVKGITIAGGEC
jgi:hypothetical protein